MHSDSNVPEASAFTKVIAEDGRWAVWLQVSHWTNTDPAGFHPIENDWHRIMDYANRRDAEISARIISRSVNRSIRTNEGY